MLSSRWHKVLNDLWGNKLRTALIVLSIAVGLFAVGTILSAQTLLSTGMAQSYHQINPLSRTVRTVEPFDESFLLSVRLTPVRGERSMLASGSRPANGPASRSSPSPTMPTCGLTKSGPRRAPGRHRIARS